MYARLMLTIAVLAIAATPAAAMTIASGDFADGAAIPAQDIYPRCGGQNVSPGLSWTGVPAGTKSLVLTMIDVSVKPAGWTHWIIVDLPPDAAALGRNLVALPAPALAIPSNFGDPHYDGPCPPDGTGLHRYEFTIWAMPDARTTILPDAKADDVTAMLAKRALAHATVAGTVTR